MHRLDVAIAGGGIVGLCIAYELASRGFRAAILDGTDARMASSYGNAGYISPALGPLSISAKEAGDVAHYLARDTGMSDMLEYLESTRTATSSIADRPEIRMLIRQMAIEGREWYARMSSILGFVYRGSGLLEVYLTREGLERRVEYIRSMASALKIQYRILEGDEVFALEPAVTRRCAGALYYPEDAVVEPVALMRALRDALADLGVTFLGNLEYIEWDGGSGRKKVRCFKSSDVIRAETYIVCTGAYRVKGLSLPVVGARGYMVEVSCNAGTLPSHPLLCGEHRIAISTHSYRLRITGFFEPCRIGSVPDDGRFNTLLERGREYMLIPQDIAIVDRWAGYRPCTPDGLPMIGRVGDQDDSNLILATGHCRLGITLAPATARLVAELVGGSDDSTIPDVLKPNRYGMRYYHGPVA